MWCFSLVASACQRYLGRILHDETQQKTIEGVNITVLRLYVFGKLSTPPAAAAAATATAVATAAAAAVVSSQRLSEKC